MGQTLGITVGIGVALGTSVATSFQSLSTRVTGLSAQMKTLQTSQKAAAKLMAAETALTSAKTAHLTGATAQTQKALDRAQLSYNRAAQSAKRYGIDATNIAKTHASLTSEIGKTESALGRLQQRQENQAKRKEMIGEIASTAAAAYVLSRPINAAKNFESEFTGLKKVADFKSVEDETAFKNQVFQTSTRTGMSSSGVLQLAKSAAEAGVASDENGEIDTTKMDEFTNTASEMAVAMDITAEEAGEFMKKYQSNMRLTGAETRALGDTINYLSSSMNATPAAISTVTATVGPLGQTVGLAEKSMAALSAAFVETTKSPEVAATALQRFLITVGKGKYMTESQKKVMRQLGFTNTQAIADGLKAGGKQAEDTVLMVMEAIAKAPAAQQAGILNEVFGDSAIGAVAPLLNNLDSLRNAFDKANSAEAQGSMAKEFQSVSNTTQGAIDRIGASVDQLSIAVGSALLPPLAATLNAAQPLITTVAQLAEANPELTTAVVGLAGAFIAAKIASLSCVYAGTMVSDAWGMAKSVGSALVSTYKFFTPTVLRSNAALAVHKAQIIGATLASGRQRAITLAGTAAIGIKTGALAAYNGALALTRARTYAAIAGFVAQRAIMIGGAAIAGIMTAAQWGLNVALTANPVGLIVVGIAALAAGMVYLYNTCEPVRVAFDAVWAGIVTGVSKVWDYVQWVWGGVSSVLSAIGVMEDETDDLKATNTGMTAGATTPQAVMADATRPMPPMTAANTNYDTAGSAFGISGMEVSSITGATTQHSGGGSSVSAPITLNITLNGVPSQDVGQVLVEAIRARSGEIEQQLSTMIDRIASNQRRLAYG